MTDENLGQRFDLRLVRGADWAVSVELLQDDGTTPVDLTGATFTGAVVERIGKAEVRSITVTPTNLALGRFGVKLTKADTLALPERADLEWKLFYEISGVARHLFYGGVAVVNGSGS